MIKDGEKDKSKIKEICYKIASFVQYEFNKELEKVIELVGELELPDKHIPGNTIKKWEELKKSINKLKDGENYEK